MPAPIPLPPASESTVPDVATARQVCAVEEGHHVFLSQVLEELRRLLVARRHQLAEHGNRKQRMVKLRPVELTTTSDYLEVPVGLWPVATRWLDERHYAVQYSSTGGILPLEHSLPNRHPYLSFLQARERGLIRYGSQVDPAWLVAQVAQAYPLARIAVCVVKREVEKVAARLSQRLPSAFRQELAYVQKHTSDVLAMRRIVVGTTHLMSEYWVGERELMFAWNAQEAIGELGRWTLPYCNKSRLFGLLNIGEQLAPYDEDCIRAVFGFNEFLVPTQDSVERPIEVVFATVTNSTANSSNCNKLAVIKRQGIWENPIRNRRVAALAQSVAEGNWSRAAQRARGLARFADRGQQRTLVLVENDEHANELHRQLGWPVLTVETSRQSHNLHLDHGCQDLIVTFGSLSRLDASRYDVIVRADGGVGVPDCLQAACVSNYQAFKPLIVVDFDDRFHPILRKRSRERRQVYRQFGWQVGDETPFEARVTDFIASRPGRQD